MSRSCGIGGLEGDSWDRPARPWTITVVLPGNRTWRPQTTSCGPFSRQLDRGLHSSFSFST